MWHVLLLLTIVLSMSCGSSACAANSQNADKSAKSDKSPPSNATKSPKEIDILLDSLKQAVAEGNSQSAASLWTENTIFIDESGEEIQGRSALQQRFENLFQDRKSKSDTALRIEFEPERVTLPSENIALVVGVVTRRTGEENISATRFSMVLEKQKEKWRIAQATETRISAGSAYEHLCDLAWLIGDWKTTTPRGSALVKAEWAPGKNFISITSVTTSKDSLQTTDRQVIGWDERTGSIVSWFFGHSGNFAYGTWRHDGGEWLVDVNGTGSDGTELRSTDVYSPKEKGQFLWQSVSRSTAGTSLPDTDNLTVEKVSGGVR